MKTFRCPSEMQFLRHGHEITKMSKFNVRHDSRLILRNDDCFLIICNTYQ